MVCCLVIVSLCLVFTPEEYWGTYYARVARAIMHGHVSTLSAIMAVGKKLVHKVFQGEASLLVDACFSILSENCIVWG